MMTIDAEKLRALLAAATPGPWGWNLGALETMTDAGKGFPLNFYPDSVTVAESGTCYECRARPNDINTSEANAALIAAAVNALPELLDALATVEAERLTLARALAESLPERARGAAYRIRRHNAVIAARRIVAEADAAEVAT